MAEEIDNKEVIDQVMDRFPGLAESGHDNSSADMTPFGDPRPDSPIRGAEHDISEETPRPQPTQGVGQQPQSRVEEFVAQIGAQQQEAAARLEGLREQRRAEADKAILSGQVQEVRRQEEERAQREARSQNPGTPNVPVAAIYQSEVDPQITDNEPFNEVQANTQIDEVQVRRPDQATPQTPPLPVQLQVGPPPNLASNPAPVSIPEQATVQTSPLIPGQDEVQQRGLPPGPPWVPTLEQEPIQISQSTVQQQVEPTSPIGVPTPQRQTVQDLRIDENLVLQDEVQEEREVEPPQEQEVNPQGIHEINPQDDRQVNPQVERNEEPNPPPTNPIRNPQARMTWHQSLDHRGPLATRPEQQQAQPRRTRSVGTSAQPPEQPPPLPPRNRAIAQLNAVFRNDPQAPAFHAFVDQTIPGFQPSQAMEMLHHIQHLTAAPDDRALSPELQKVLISKLQEKSRQDPVQHVQGYLQELSGIRADQQAASAEFSELKKTINGLSKAQARQLVGPPGFKKANYPRLDGNAFRELKEGIKNRAQVRVWGSRGTPQEFKDLGDFGFKTKAHRDPAPSNLSPSAQDAFNQNYQALTPAFAEDGRKFYERSTYLNVSKLQVNREIGRLALEGKTKLGETGVRSYVGTAQSIDPANIGPGYQSFVVGAQVQHNYLHSKYAAKYERGNDTVKGTGEASFDGYVGHSGDVRCAIAIGRYPMVQIQGAKFAGGRAAIEVKTKLNVRGHDAAEVKGKAFASAGAEVAGTVNLGRVYDVIEGKTVTTGMEVGGMAFAGVRVGGEVGGNIAGFGAKLKGELWHGIGLVKKMYLQKEKDGTLSCGGEFGAALGVGGAVAWGVTINPGKIAKALPDRVTTRAKELTQPVGEFALNAVRPVGELAKSAGRAAGLPRLAQAGKDAVNAAVERAKANLEPRDRQINPTLIDKIRRLVPDRAPGRNGPARHAPAVGG